MSFDLGAFLAKYEPRWVKRGICNNGDMPDGKTGISLHLVGDYSAYNYEHDVHMRMYKARRQINKLAMKAVFKAIRYDNVGDGVFHVTVFHFDMSVNVCYKYRFTEYQSGRKKEHISTNWKELVEPDYPAIKDKLRNEGYEIC